MPTYRYILNNNGFLLFAIVCFQHIAQHHATNYFSLIFRSGASRRHIFPFSKINGATIDTGNHNISESNSSISSNDEYYNERIAYVKNILTDRVRYVEKGKRVNDLMKWVKKKDGESTVLSVHGANLDDMNNQQPLSSYEHLHTKPLSLYVPSKRRQGNPFNDDQMDLDIPLKQKMSIIEFQPETQLNHDKHLLEDDKNISALQLIIRAMQLCFHFSPALSTVGIAIFSRKFRPYWYSIVSNSLGRGGAAFIKWGQWAATRNDMFPDTLCSQLSRLHSAAPAHSWSISEITLESCLGLPRGTLLDVFDYVDTQPIASGSIAQVHKASIDGTQVAIKVRHPRVSQLMDMDFRIMAAFATIFDYVPGFAWLHVRESVNQFSHTMKAQANLHVEAHHLELLNYNFRKWPTVRFPHPFYASRCCIIESYEPGRLISDAFDAFDRLKVTKHLEIKSSTLHTQDKLEEAEDASVCDKNTSMDNHLSKMEGSQPYPLSISKFVVTTGLALYYKMLLFDNLMHADFHPGNILLGVFSKEIPKGLVSTNDDSSSGTCDILRVLDNSRSDKFAITMVDAGMVAQLSEVERTTFIGLLSCLGEGDGHSAGKYALQFSSENNMNEEQRNAFIGDMENMFKERCRGYGTNVHVGQTLQGILELIRKHHVLIGANYATLTINLLCLESLARRICPNYNVLEAAQPLLQNYYKACFRPDGTLKPTSESQKNMQLKMSLLFMLKNIKDNRFFRKQRRLMANNKSEI